MKANIAIAFTAIAIAALAAAAKEKLPMPSQLDGQITNVYTSSKLSPKAIGELSDHSKCGVSSDDLGMVGMLTGLMTRPNHNSTEVQGGVLESRGTWRAMYWSRHPETPVCAFRAEPHEQGATLEIYGVLHAREAQAVTAIENGKFFCSCGALSK